MVLLDENDGHDGCGLITANHKSQSVFYLGVHGGLILNNVKSCPKKSRFKDLNTVIVHYRKLPYHFVGTSPLPHHSERSTTSTSLYDIAIDPLCELIQFEFSFNLTTQSDLHSSRSLSPSL